MTYLRFLSAGVVTCLIARVVFAADAPESDVAAYSAHIKPILAAHCYQCHGSDEQEGGLRLDGRQAALEGGDSGVALVPGNSAESELYRRVTSEDEDERMPPDYEESVRPLSAEQVKLIRMWIDQGATWPADADAKTKASLDHWSFQPVVRHAPPPVQNADWVRNPIDRFVLARLEQESIQPSPEADRHTLIKRLYYDLLGLPPTLEEVDRFVDDQSPDAYEELVDEILGSPHFGERWGRHWLDKARYADSDGYEKDRPRPNAWRYRDWVIEALNRDMAFDQFSIEQIAGDLLPNSSPIEHLATAFNRQTLTNTEGGVDQEEFRVLAIKDRINTLGTVWLGLTVGCADCHSHKYDPITQREYYQLFAFFNNADEVNTELSISEEAMAEYERQKADHDGQLAELNNKLAEHRKELSASLPQWEAKTRTELAAERQAPVEFHRLAIESVVSQEAAVFEQLDDGSYLATGDNPEKDQYTIEATCDLDQVSGFRIEALTHESLSGRGPGRTAHGNFVLSEFEAFAGAGDKPGKESRLPFDGAEADFSQDGWPVAAAVDGKEDTGWAISPQMGKDHWAVFRVHPTLPGEKAKRLRFVLRFGYGSQHVLARFRIMARTGSQPGDGLPEDIRAILTVTPEKRDAKQTDALLDYVLSQDEAGRKLEQAVEDWKKKTPKRPTMTVRVIGPRTSNPRNTHVLRRGDFLQPAAEVDPATLEVLHPLTARNREETPDRFDLAQWLVDPANPLTSRVIVNHIWSHLFGRGLVTTPSDFGVRGEPPTHPRLLDWLATELIERGWSRKSMIKLIVSSATYRQSSRHRPELANTDPLNNLLARQNRFRVDAEIVRDLYLAASGLLTTKIGGPSVYPPMPADVAALSYANNFKWTTSQGDDRYRRGMYTFFKRTSPHPNLIAFDCPDANTTNVQRWASNTPLQALTTLNNEVFVEAAQAMTRRVLTAAAVSTDADRITYAFRLCVARGPSEAERDRFVRLLSKARAWYGERPEPAKELVGQYQPDGITPTEAAAWVATTRILLNMDEFITRE